MTHMSEGWSIHSIAQNWSIHSITLYIYTCGFHGDRFIDFLLMQYCFAITKHKNLKAIIRYFVDLLPYPLNPQRTFVLHNMGMCGNVRWGNLILMT